MSRLRSERHLTEPDPAFGQIVKTTPEGMAFWAGTGPADQTCASCRWFRGKRWKGDLHPGRCAQYIKMMKRAGFAKAPVLRIPHDTQACKYFEVKEVQPAKTAKMEAIP